MRQAKLQKNMQDRDAYNIHIRRCLSPKWMPVETVAVQSSHPGTNRSLRNSCNDAWKSLTVTCRMISAGNRLYTQIRPNALLRSISKKCVFRMSTSCRLCLPLRILCSEGQLRIIERTVGNGQGLFPAPVDAIFPS